MNNSVTSKVLPVSEKRSAVMPMIIIGSLFFIFGFITWINGTLIPYLRIACELKTSVESYLVATAFFIAYTVMGIPSSIVLKNTGYKKGISLGLLIMSIGALIFIPAAHARSYPLFLTGLFIIGTGLALLQTASNPYISIIGPIESAATRISIMGICNKTAGILASLIFGYIALKDADQLTARLQQMNSVSRNETLNELASRVIVPYIIIAIVLLVLSLLILLSSLPDIKDENSALQDISNKTADKESIFKFPHLMIGVAALFLYVGAEVMAGDTIISYGHSLGIKMSTAKFFTSATLVCMLVGYIIGIFTIPKYITQQKALSICAVLGVVFSLAAVFSNGYVSVAFIAALGLANSLMWPAIFPLAIRGLGKFTKTGSAMLIMAIAGGALLPLLYGWLSGFIGTQLAYLLLIPCYIFIFYFAVSGYKK